MFQTLLEGRRALAISSQPFFDRSNSRGAVVEKVRWVQDLVETGVLVVHGIRLFCASSNSGRGNARGAVRRMSSPVTIMWGRL